MKKINYLLIAWLLHTGCFSNKNGGGQSSQLKKIDTSLESLDLSQEGPSGFNRLQYAFMPAIDSRVLKDEPTDLRAELTIPNDEQAPNDGYPLVVIMHGNHAPCAFFNGDRQLEPNQILTHQSCRESICELLEDSYRESGDLNYHCPADLNAIEVASNEGYRYITDFLASHGFVSLSINTNFNINGRNGFRESDPLFIEPRARLLLKHIALLQRLNRGENPPETSEIDLRGKINFQHVGFMGHSRGGEAVRLAYQLLQAREPSTYAEYLDPIKVQGILEIAPTDSISLSDMTTMQNTNWSVIIPSCDGDVYDYSGYRAYQRQLISSNAEHVSAMTIHGADHNSFNTEWIYNDGQCFSGQNILDRSTVMEISKQINYAFFKGFIGVNKDKRLQNIFDPQYRLPRSLSDLMNFERESRPKEVSDKINLLPSSQSNNIRFLESRDYERGVYIIDWNMIKSSQSNELILKFTRPLTIDNDIISLVMKPLNLWKACDFAKNSPCPGQQDSMDFSISLKGIDGSLSKSVRLSDYKKLSERFTFQINCDNYFEGENDPICNEANYFPELVCGGPDFQSTSMGCILKKRVSEETCTQAGGTFANYTPENEERCFLYGENMFRHVPMQEIPIEISDFDLDTDQPIEAIVIGFDSETTGTFVLYSDTYLRSND